jgi:hypothetical protein
MTEFKFDPTDPEWRRLPNPNGGSGNALYFHARLRIGVLAVWQSPKWPDSYSLNKGQLDRLMAGVKQGGKIVEGYVALIRVTDNHQMVVNEKPVGEVANDLKSITPRNGQFGGGSYYWLTGDLVAQDDTPF